MRLLGLFLLRRFGPIAVALTDGIRRLAAASEKAAAAAGRLWSTSGTADRDACRGIGRRDDRSLTALSLIRRG
jgi:hypothetical protein